jgi:peptide/nickel transport system permease protein
MAVLGPDLAPHNPFLVKPLQWIDGELHKAPFPPGKLYPLGTDDLGRDQLSLLLYGARTTLVMAFIATVVRMLLGLMLGTFAGWWPGSLFDRGVTAFAEFMASIPGLILAILLVYAIGIHRGQTAFIVALALVGSGEVAQIMRGHVLTIRKEQYIEAARAVGLSSPEILSRHVLPNLLGTLLALAALEMGSVLLLLGELGFLHIFIGGGRVGFSEASREAHHYFDVPDWGAMLGTSWRWFRSYPWFPLAPAAAFFVAILGFNLFGYGLQRFVERGRFHPSGWSVLRFLAVVALMLLGARALVLGTGVEAQFADMAEQLDAGRAWDDAAYLTQLQSEAQHSGADEPSDAAQYIAAEFREIGLSPTTPEGGYSHPYTTLRGQVTRAPELVVLGATGEPQLELSDGLTLDPWQAFSVDESIEAELMIGASLPRVVDEGIWLLLDPDDDIDIPWTGYQPYKGVLRVVPDDELGRNDRAPRFDGSSFRGLGLAHSFPSLLIGESAARDLLAQAGLDLDELQAEREAGQKFELHTGLPVRLTVGLTYKESPATNVIGYIAGMDVESRGERILVAASYVGDNSGTDENASGVAVMLETARLLQELEFMPKRTIAFAAFDEGGGYEFVIDPALPTTRSELWTTVIIHGVGAGDPKLARAEAGSGLARAFDQSARRFGARTVELDEWPFFFIAFTSRLSWGEPEAHTSYQGVVVTRLGDDLSGSPSDTLEHLDPEKLEEAAQALAHYVMVLSFR